VAFVVLHSKEDYRRWIKLYLSLGCKHTVLAATGERSVLALPDQILDDLAEHKVAFTALREEQLLEYLTSVGLAYYHHLREHRPDHLYFNAPLPPALHFALTCTVPEYHIQAVRQIVERYHPIAIHTQEVTVETIPVQPDAPAAAEAMVQVEFTVPRAHQQALIDELIASGAAGTSRLTAIFVQSDPDVGRHRKRTPYLTRTQAIKNWSGKKSKAPRRCVWRPALPLTPDRETTSSLDCLMAKSLGLF
jgi:hypothetical protein